MVVMLWRIINWQIYYYLLLLEEESQSNQIHNRYLSLYLTNISNAVVNTTS